MSEAEHIEAEVAKGVLREVLRPFAEAAASFDASQNDGYITSSEAFVTDGVCGLTVGDLRHARELFKRCGGGA